jgi:hypothetical protein
MISPGATPEEDLPAGEHAPPESPARELSNEELRAKVAALAEQVRQLGNGNHQMPEWRPAPPAKPDLDVIASEPGGAAGGVQHGAAGSSDPGAGEPEEMAQQSSRLLATVIETAELAAAEIRAGAEREAADIRQRASAAVDEAKAALARYREALGALHGETERVEHSIAALREQTLALEADRANIDAAVELLRRHSAPR